MKQSVWRELGFYWLEPHGLTAQRSCDVQFQAKTQVSIENLLKDTCTVVPHADALPIEHPGGCHVAYGPVRVDLEPTKFRGRTLIYSS